MVIQIKKGWLKMDRNKLLEILQNKAKELNLDTSIADSVMGIGKAIQILNEQIKNEMSFSTYNDFILSINNLGS